MKLIIEQPEKDALATINSQAAQVLLHHVLSPLEKAALRHGFRPFRYQLNNTSIDVNGFYSRQLLHHITHKLNALTTIVAKEHKNRHIPYRLRAVLDDPAHILGLPAQTRNRLCTMECYTMYGVIQRGREFFINAKGFGRRSLSSLDELFAKHKASELFK